MNDHTSPSEFELPASSPVAAACWSRIGVHGDRSCAEIPRYVHCRNCPVYVNAGAQLFDRAPPSEWLEEQRARLAEIDEQLSCDTITVLIFRLGSEYFAVDVLSMLEVAEPRSVHRVPHRTGGNLEGIVNIRGELQLCISLARLMGLGETSQVDSGSDNVRFLVTEHGRQRWVFAVDEVLGVQRLERLHRTEIPATLRRSSNRMSRHVYDWNGKHVCHLDADRLFAAMQKGLQ